MMTFDLRKDKKSIIRVIGVGGGGSNAVKHMFREGITDVNFAISNTDVQALNDNDIPTKIQLGPQLTGGLGAGNDPEKGRQACIESKDEIISFLDDGCKMIFVAACLGGGTGTGAAPVICKLAREMDLLTIGVVTLPNSIDGPKRINQARVALEEMREHADAVVVISNDKIRTFYGSLTPVGAMAKADDILLKAAKSIAEIITKPCNINTDFNDVKATMQNCGECMMGIGEGSGDNRCKMAAEEALNTPLLEETNIKGASKILMTLTHGGIEPTYDELMDTIEYIKNDTGHDTQVIWGYGFNADLEDRVSITLIATGFEKDNVSAVAVTEPSFEIVDSNEIPIIDNIYDSIEDVEPRVSSSFTDAKAFIERMRIERDQQYVETNTMEKIDYETPSYERNHYSLKISKQEVDQPKQNGLTTSNYMNGNKMSKFID